MWPDDEFLRVWQAFANPVCLQMVPHEFRIEFRGVRRRKNSSRWPSVDRYELLDHFRPVRLIHDEENRLRRAVSAFRNAIIRPSTTMRNTPLRTHRRHQIEPEPFASRRHHRCLAHRRPRGARMICSTARPLEVRKENLRACLTGFRLQSQDSRPSATPGPWRAPVQSPGEPAAGA